MMQVRFIWRHNRSFISDATPDCCNCIKNRKSGYACNNQKLVKFNAKFVKKEDDKENSLEIKVVNCTSLGQNKYLHTIEHNNKYLLIASTPQNITLLKEYPKENED